MYEEDIDMAHLETPKTCTKCGKTKPLRQFFTDDDTMCIICSCRETTKQEDKMIVLNNHNDLREYFARCVDMHVPVALFITLPGCEKPELIVNQRINFEPKLDYYLETYRDDLTHKFAQGVKIVGATIIQEIW